MGRCNAPTEQKTSTLVQRGWNTLLFDWYQHYGNLIDLSHICILARNPAKKHAAFRPTYTERWYRFPCSTWYYWRAQNNFFRRKRKHIAGGVMLTTMMVTAGWTATVHAAREVQISRHKATYRSIGRAVVLHCTYLIIAFSPEALWTDERFRRSIVLSEYIREHYALINVGTRCDRQNQITGRTHAYRAQGPGFDPKFEAISGGPPAAHAAINWYSVQSWDRSSERKWISYVTSQSSSSRWPLTGKMLSKPGFDYGTQLCFTNVATMKCGDRWNFINDIQMGFILICHHGTLLALAKELRQSIAKKKWKRYSRSDTFAASPDTRGMTLAKTRV